MGLFVQRIKAFPDCILDLCQAGADCSFTLLKAMFKTVGRLSPTNFHFAGVVLYLYPGSRLSVVSGALRSLAYRADLDSRPSRLTDVRNLPDNNVTTLSRRPFRKPDSRRTVCAIGHISVSRTLRDVPSRNVRDSRGESIR